MIWQQRVAHCDSQPGRPGRGPGAVKRAHACQTGPIVDAVEVLRCVACIARRLILARNGMTSAALSSIDESQRRCNQHDQSLSLCEDDSPSRPRPSTVRSVRSPRIPRIPRIQGYEASCPVRHGNDGETIVKNGWGSTREPRTRCPSSTLDILNIGHSTLDIRRCIDTLLLLGEKQRSPEPWWTTIHDRYWGCATVA